MSEVEKLSQDYHDYLDEDGMIHADPRLMLGEANKPDGFEDSIDDVAAEGTATVVGSTWTTLNGMKIAEPKQRGIYIRVDKMSDGTSRAVKVLVR